MSSIKVAKIWMFYFLSGFFILQIHTIRYLNSFLTGYTPWADKIIDYDFITGEGLIIRFIVCILSWYLLKTRENRPVASTTLIWILAFILLSNEHDINTFFSMFIISFFSLLTNLYLHFNKNMFIK